jgi:PAS domain S-box-containing protein
VQVWAQRRLGRLGFVLAGVLLVAVGVVSYRQMLRLQDARDLTTHTLLVREEIEILFSLIKDAETGQRGFLLTGDPKYLEPYEAATRLVLVHTTRLRELTADNAAQQAQLVRLDGLVGAKLSELATTLRAARTEGFPTASRIVRTDVGIRLMDDIRTLLAAMRDEESRLYAERERRMDQAARTATTGNIAGLVVAFALVLGATLLTVRAIRHRDREHALRQTSEAMAAASQASEARLRTTLESIGDGVITTDDAGRVTLMNPVAQALTGWTDAGARGRPIEDVFAIINEATRQPVENPVTKVRREGNIVGLANHTILISRDGREIPIADSAAPIKVAGGRVQGVVVVFRDVTSQYELERQRTSVLQIEQAARQEAEAANRAKDEFVATLSHELRTPLSSIFGWTRMLQSGALDATAAHRAVEVIERNARTQMQLIDDLLDTSRMVAGKLRLELHAVDLGGVVNAAVDTIRPAAQAKGVGIEVHVSEPPVIVAGDPDRLQQVVWNLLSNAIRFTPAGGHVDVWLEAHQGQQQIRVVDTGSGIKPEFLPHVFERFRQADASSSRTYSGLGIGLALVRHLVELHGGAVVAQSEGEGRGATFCVRLPRRSPDQDLQPLRLGAAPDIADPSRQLAGLHVLVVDDEADARELARLAFERAGARVTLAASAAEALATVEAGPVDVLVSDIGMPGTNGYVLLESVRGRVGTPIPAIALTAYARLEDRERALKAGFELHVPKPIDPARLVRAVALVVHRSGPAA